MEDKRGQLDYPIITFIVIIIMLIIFAPIGLKIIRNFQAALSPQFGNITYGQPAQAAVNTILTTTISFWDELIVWMFFIAILLLIISSIFIDTHPFWIFLYVLLSFFTIIFAPDIIDSIGTIYDSAEFTQEVASLSFMNFLRNNFGTFLVGIMIFTGIIIFGKIALFRSGGSRA